MAFTRYFSNLLSQILTVILISAVCTEARPVESNPYLGAWSSWTPCSRQCGSAALSSQTRPCLKNCKGDKKTNEERYRSCCTQTCSSGPFQAGAAGRCSQLQGNWTEVATTATGCSVICTNQSTPHVSQSSVLKELQLPLGTFCRTKQGSDGVCLKDRCAAIGCDGVVGSNRKRDKCFQCISSSTDCRLVRGVRSVTLSPSAIKSKIIPILRIPARSSFLRISHALSVNGTRLAVKELDGRKVFQGGENGTTFTAAGVHFTYHLLSSARGNNTEELVATGPTEASFTVLLLVTASRPSSFLTPVRYSYYHLETASEMVSVSNSNSTATCGDNSPVSTHAPTNSIFYWDYRDGDCSASCGKGVKIVEATCVDRMFPDRPLVDQLCEERGLVKPQPVVQLCHLRDCPPVWRSGEWSSCNGTCGQEATQSRSVRCEQFQEESWDPVILADQEACGADTKPVQERSCNRSECHYMWRTGTWSKCSLQVVQGLQYRSVECYHRGHGLEVDHTHCDTSTRPAGIRNCLSKNCTNGRCCAWMPLPWDKCDVGCGVGGQTRAIGCRYMDTGDEAGQSCCAGLTQPLRRRDCWSTRDLDCHPSWQLGEYGKCTGECCSEDQFQSRSVTCSARTSQGVQVDLPDQACAAHLKQNTTASCQRTDCPRWNESSWSECSTPSPPECGRRIRTVRCLLDGADVDGCCGDQSLEAEACLPCNPVTKPPECDGPDLFDCSSSLFDVCEDAIFRPYCCKTCRDRSHSQLNADK